MSETKVRVILIEANDVSCLGPLLEVLATPRNGIPEAPPPRPPAALPKPRKPAERAQNGLGPARKQQETEALQEIAKLLANGPMRIAELVEQLEKPYSTVYSQLSHEWFHKMDSGHVRLTKAGEAEGLAADQAAAE